MNYIWYKNTDCLFQYIMEVSITQKCSTLEKRCVGELKDVTFYVSSVDDEAAFI